MGFGGCRPAYSHNFGVQCMEFRCITTTFPLGQFIVRYLQNAHNNVQSHAPALVSPWISKISKSLGKLCEFIKQQSNALVNVTKFSIPDCSIIPTFATWGFAAWLLPSLAWSIGTVYLTDCSMIQIIVAINHRAILKVSQVGMWNCQWLLFCSQL